MSNELILCVDLGGTKTAIALIKDAELASRCRRASESHYALTPACERQFKLYNILTRL